MNIWKNGILSQDTGVTVKIWEPCFHVHFISFTIIKKNIELKKKLRHTRIN